MTTVTEFTVTSRVWPLERSIFFNRAGCFDRLLLLLSAFVLPGDFTFDTTCAPPDAPGKACVAACCAARAEFSRGFRVDVPGTE